MCGRRSIPREDPERRARLECVQPCGGFSRRDAGTQREGVRQLRNALGVCTNACRPGDLGVQAPPAAICTPGSVDPTPPAAQPFHVPRTVRRGVQLRNRTARARRPRPDRGRPHAWLAKSTHRRPRREPRSRAPDHAALRPARQRRNRLRVHAAHNPSAKAVRPRSFSVARRSRRGVRDPDRRWVRPGDRAHDHRRAPRLPERATSATRPSGNPLFASIDRRRSSSRSRPAPPTSCTAPPRMRPKPNSAVKLTVVTGESRHGGYFGSWRGGRDRSRPPTMTRAVAISCTKFGIVMSTAPTSR